MRPSKKADQVIAAFNALGTADQEAVLRRLRLVRQQLSGDAPADIDRAVSGVDWLSELAPGPDERNIAEAWKPVGKDKRVEPGTVSAANRKGASR